MRSLRKCFRLAAIRALAALAVLSVLAVSACAPTPQAAPTSSQPTTAPSAATAAPTTAPSAPTATSSTAAKPTTQPATDQLTQLPFRLNWTLYGEHAFFLTALGKGFDMDWRPIDPELRDPFGLQIEQFLAGIVRGEPTKPDWEDAVTNQRLIKAATRSAALGREVSLQEIVSEETASVERV